jgi:predicted transposase YdaD
MGIEELLLDLAEKKGIAKGREEGIEKGKTEKQLEDQLTFTRNLLTSTDFDTVKIAQLVGVTEKFVLKVKKELGL